MNTAAVYETLRELADRHEHLLVDEADGVTVIRCLRCDYTVKISR